MSKRKSNYIFIACEGHTEAGYLKEIVKRERKPAVKIKFCCLEGEQNPTAFVEKAYSAYIEEIKEFRDTHKLKGKVFVDDSVWCVYDIDNKSPGDIIAFENLAKQKEILTARSHPSIEFWFLLHFISVDLSRQYTQDQAEKELKKEWKKYHKADRSEKTFYLETLDDREEFAEKNADDLRLLHQVNASNITDGPRTYIDILLNLIKH
jgi:uncharacterized protein YifE (UPF0438 family)